MRYGSTNQLKWKANQANRVAAQHLGIVQPPFVPLNGVFSEGYIGIAESTGFVYHYEQVLNPFPIGTPLQFRHESFGWQEEGIDVLDSIYSEFLACNNGKIERVKMAAKNRTVQRPLSQ